MALTKDTPREHIIGDREDYPVAAAAVIFEGSAIGEDGSGFARPLQAGDAFLGFAMREADNLSGTAGAIRVEVRRRGRVELSVTSLVQADNDGVAVYASDDGTFTKTATANSFVGYVSRFISAGVGIVDYDAALAKSA